MKKALSILFLGLTATTFAQFPTPFCYSPTTSNNTFTLATQDNGKGLNSFDIDNDGKIDLIYPTYSGYLRKRLGLGNGLFSTTATTINCGGMNYDKVDLYDFNNDSKLDLLLSGTFQLAYLKNNGNGTFAASYTITGQTLYTVNDFDNDGYPDIVSINNSFPIKLAVTRNNTNNTFSTTLNSLTFTPDGITSGDYNNDGNKDLLISRTSTITSGLGHVEFFAGNGAMGFAAPVTVISTNPYSVKDLKSFDFNNDGIDDLAASTNNALGNIYLCNSSAVFTQYKELAKGGVSSLQFSDINNDTYKDIINVSNNLDNLNVMYGNSAYSYTSIVRYASDEKPSTLTINDLNGDGYNEVITDGFNTPVGFPLYSTILNSSSGLQAPVYFQIQPYNYVSGNYGFETADFNNDGLLDLAFSGDTVKVFQNMGSGNYSLVYNQRISVQTQAAITAGDVNKDGKMDIVFGTFIAAQWNLSFMLGNGNFTFQAPVHVYGGSGIGEIKLLDFNNDGYPDAMTDQGLYKNNAGASYSMTPGMTMYSSSGFNHGDFNGDGYEDICYAGPNYSICTEINLAGTGFASPTTFSLCSNSIGDMSVLDYNKDGKKDIMVAHGNCTSPWNVFSCFAGNGNNTFAAPFIIPSYGAGSLTSGDVNSDGYPDVVSASNYNWIHLLINNKAGNFNSYQVKDLSFNGKCILADFNNDGSTDIATGGNFTLGGATDVSFFYNTTPKITPNTDKNLCGSSSFYLKKLGAYPGFTWSPSGSTADSILINTSGYYALQNTNTLNQCYCSVGINVNITPTPTLTIFGNNPICAGSSQVMTVIGASSYTWSTGPTTNTLAISPTVTTTYSVTGQTSGCNGTGVKTITVNPLPIVTGSSSSTLICTGQTATLTGNGANSYTWNPGGTGTSIPVSPTVTTTYTLTGTDLNNCTKTTVLTQSVSTCIGINSSYASQNEFTLYPNPNNGSFKLQLSLENCELIIYNLVRQKVFSQKLNYAENEIKTEGLSKGLYHYSILQNKTQIQTGKIVIE